MKLKHFRIIFQTPKGAVKNGVTIEGEDAECARLSFEKDFKEMEVIKVV